jgi:hypothetical protein
MPGLRSPDIPAWKIALKDGDLNPLTKCVKIDFLTISQSSNFFLLLPK